MPSPSLPQQKEGVPVIRRLFMPLVALAVVAAVLIASAPADAGTRRLGMGVWIPAANRNASVYDQFAATVGRRPAVVTMSVQWGDPNLKKFPMAQAKHARSKGSAVMITWTPTINPITKETGKYARFKRIAKGKHDKYIKSFARDIKRYGKPVWLRFAHEINASLFPWSKGWGMFYNPLSKQRDIPNDNNPKQFKKAYVRIYNIFQKLNVNNARFMWTVAKESCSGCNPYKKWYPNKGVHYAGFSDFNWGNFNGRSWSTFMQSMKQPMKNFKQFTRKPIVVAELGTTQFVGPNNQTKADWLAQGYPAVRKAYPNVKAVIYQHTDSGVHGHPNWDLNDPPGSINAYKNLLKKTKFQGKVNKKGYVK